MLDGCVSSRTMNPMTRRRIDRSVARLVRARQLADAQHAAPALLGVFGRLRQQRRLVVDVEHARGVFGALHVASHPEQVIRGAGEHVQQLRRLYDSLPPSEAKPGAGMRRRSNAAALRCAEGSLRCSVSWPAEKLASRPTGVPLEQSRRVRARSALARAAMSPVLLGAAYVAADAHPPPALPAPLWHASSNSTSVAARWAVPGVGDLWGGEKRSVSGSARAQRAAFHF